MILRGVKLITLKRRIAISMIVFGLVLAALAVLLVIRGSSPTGVQLSPNMPSSKKPSPSVINNYTAATDLPRYINIPAISVPKTRIMQLGLLKDNEIDTPNNIYDAGWYTGSAKPGQDGAMFVFGHVSNWTADGVFYNLKKLVPGNVVTVTRGDNKEYKYKVVSTKVYPYNNVNMEQVLTPINAHVPGLNLMTCTGTVIKGTSEFNERLVVFTSLLST